MSLTQNDPALAREINLWNSDPREIRENPQVSTMVAKTLTDALGLCFHRYKKTCQIYEITLAKAVEVFSLAKLAK